MASADCEESDPLCKRRHGKDRPDDYRSRYERDVDRILYSSAFRRLSGVTQVVSADETLLFHNRLTHTLKVSQVARRLSENLCEVHKEALRHGDGLNPAAACAAAMAHDLGHPPFGHIAEETLRRLCDKAEINGYEGNAQTFRIVARLAQRTEMPGLNLTRRTLKGILKYPWMRVGEDHASDRKWGAYESEASDFRFATGIDQDRVSADKSLEAFVMDWADDITYAVHDLEDFYRAGFTPISRLQQDPKERARFIAKATEALAQGKSKTQAEPNRFDPEKGADAFTEIMETIPLKGPYQGRHDDRRLLHKTSSNLITRFIEGTQLSADSASLDIPPDIWHEVNMLKQLTWHYVINSPELATIQEGQQRIIEDLFEILTEWALREEAGSRSRLPTRYHEMLIDMERDEEARHVLGNDHPKMAARVSCDYISSLTEAQAIELHGRLLGTSQRSILHGWVKG